MRAAGDELCLKFGMSLDGLEDGQVDPKIGAGDGDNTYDAAHVPAAP